jgi:hypothetical protein
MGLLDFGNEQVVSVVIVPEQGDLFAGGCRRFGWCFLEDPLGHSCNKCSICKGKVS